MSGAMKRWADDRYALVPQMVEYDRLMAPSRLRWHPHVMFFHPENYLSEVVSTDRWGFRYGSGRNGEAEISLGDLRGVSEVNLLVGGSVTFGLGCTRDSLTISSRLTALESGGAPWLNFGGRGFTSAQELVAFLLLRDELPAVRNVVLLSGLNNLVLADPATRLRSPFGEFFFSEDFYRAMEDVKHGYKPKQGLWKKLARHEGAGTAPPATASDAHGDKDRHEIAIAGIERDVRHWAAICQAQGISLFYALQPFATWPDRILNESEATLFDLLDKMAGGQSSATAEIGDKAVGARFRRAVREICDGLRVPFVDVTEAIERDACQGKWLFVDRAHLTDDGCAVVAELIDALVVAKSQPRHAGALLQYGH
ncbi:hypothetical protein WI73_21175 [Burkholderia ubonensis]|uniref:hypothetical protein n=1 Tax=Burkholderia ubonensis TaxID=101571 RepID=UPI000753DA9D|nr:hypothetical protein [Burkholderia ubonensis]KVC65605.1 hypothetical protein WI73_21175 [Burkholderia ubonensis]